MVRNEHFEDRGAALVSAAQRLPALETFHISYDKAIFFPTSEISDANGLPRCKELAELHSRTLTRLIVSMLDGPHQDNVLRLSGLPELRSLELTGPPPYPDDPEANLLHIRIDTASFKEVPQLESLHYLP